MKDRAAALIEEAARVRALPIFQQPAAALDLVDGLLRLVSDFAVVIEGGEDGDAAG